MSSTFGWGAGRDMNAGSGGSSAESTSLSDSNIDGFDDLSQDNFTFGHINYKSVGFKEALIGGSILVGGLALLAKKV